VEEGLRLILAQTPAEKRRPKKVTLPLSRESGGLLPNVDLTRSAELDDILNGL
jgi:hypothetical protein